MPQLTLVAPRSHAMRSVGLMLMSMFCFAVVDALAKVVALKYPANEVTFFRMAFGVLSAFLLCLRGRPLAERWRQLDVRGQSIRAVTLLGSSALFFAGLPYVPLSEAISIAYSEALLVIVLAPLLLGERLLPRNALAAVLGFIGVLMVVKPDNAEASLLGPGLLVASAFFGALSMIQIRRIRATDDSTTTVLYFTVLGTLVTGATLPFSWSTPSLPDLGFMLALGLLATLGQLLFTIAVRRAHAATLAPYTYTSIIWASLLGYLIWGEVLSLLSLVGIVLIVGSAVVVAVLEQPPEGSVV
ncbi:DMT family transporter [Pseudomonas nitroreducens]|uniref:DMT family transporter n=1 Tax=Pseudomonas nitroreducens TaxID=46680 RepID=UPI0026592BC8|nr:DMT family transporter [Pseudomonas nitroreducens]MCP1647913.1 drug/metabolite transporter (DMT)-like permease [Pseudomonas nitroreducens]MCP1686489.1 drug/metabolite transporter (DMT)-like permease [Pseudomonas nitroreducens]